MLFHDVILLPHFLHSELLLLTARQQQLSYGRRVTTLVTCSQ